MRKTIKYLGVTIAVLVSLGLLIFNLVYMFQNPTLTDTQRFLNTWLIDVIGISGMLFGYLLYWIGEC